MAQYKNFSQTNQSWHDDITDPVADKWVKLRNGNYDDNDNNDNDNDDNDNDNNENNDNDNNDNDNNDNDYNG